MNLRAFIGWVAIACFAAPAVAHAFLQRAEPGAGATLSTPPKTIMLTFTEKLEPVFSGVVVTDSSGRSVEADAAQIGGNSIVVPLRPLPAGTYRVIWHAVSVDTHRTEGAYSFTVKS
jgi:hypothetical protein